MFKQSYRVSPVCLLFFLGCLECQILFRYGSMNLLPHDIVVVAFGIVMNSIELDEWANFGILSAFVFLFGVTAYLSLRFVRFLER